MGSFTEIIKPRTVISFMLYGTFCYLAIVGKIEQDAVIAVVASLMTFYYAERKHEKAIQNTRVPDKT